MMGQQKKYLFKGPSNFLKWVLLYAIRCYWWLMPLKWKRPCIFRVSCSNFVFNSARDFGFVYGIMAFKERWNKCRPGYHAELKNNKLCLHLIDGSDVNDEEISEFILQHYQK